MENAIIVTIRTCDANSEITVARSQPKSPKGHGYDFQIIVNSNGITKINHSECNFIHKHSTILIKRLLRNQNISVFLPKMRVNISAIAMFNKNKFGAVLI